MNVRPTQSQIFSQTKMHLLSGFADMLSAQEMLATGKRILRPSDDAVGSAKALSFKRQLGDVARFMEAIGTSLPSVNMAASVLEDASGLVAEARELLLQGMNGSMSQSDRNTLASQIELLRENLMDVANSKSGDRYLFAGTANGTKPFGSTTVGGVPTSTYNGNGETQLVAVGLDVTLGVNVPGSDVFAKFNPLGSTLSGLTGATAGTTADYGVGYEYVTFRQDGTTGALGAGLAFAGGDTILGDHTLVVDAAAGTVQLDGGEPRAIPQPGDPDEADFVIESGLGAELHLDFTGYTGGSVATTVTGEGSVSIDGSDFTTLTFMETDLELVDPDTGAVVHLDTTGVHRSGVELVAFQGTGSVFDVLQGIADDLRNGDGLDSSELVDRLDLRLQELDRKHEDVLSGIGLMGGRSSRMQQMETRLEGVNVHLSGLLSQVEDADITEVVLGLTSAEQTLQLVQATSTRMTQNSLLNYLR